MISAPLSDIADLIPTVRAHLGPEPRACCLVVGLVGSQPLTVDVVAEDDVVRDPSMVRTAFESVVREHGVEHVVLIYHGCTPGTVDLEALAVLLEHPDGARVAVSHALRVCDELWWAVRCGPGCCDGSTHDVPREDARWRPWLSVDAGTTPHRSAPEAEAGHRAFLQQPVVLAAAQDAAGHLGWEDVVRAWARLMRAGDEWAPEDLGAVLAVFDDVVARDQLLWSIVPDLAGPEPFALPQEKPLRTLQVETAHLERLLLAVPATWRPEWLCFVAAGYWRDDALPQAVRLAEEAWGSNRQLRLAQLLSAVTSAGITYRSLSALDGPAWGAVS